MRKLFTLLVFMTTALIIGPILSATALPPTDPTHCDHSTGKSKDNFFPMFRLKTTPLFICDNYALSFLGEIGPRNYRVNGTWGFFSDNCHRFKLGGEYLGQKFHYKFTSGKVKRWMHQWALGGKYQYLFDCGSCIRGVQIGGAYSRAATRNLGSVLCSRESTPLYRRIGGSWFMDVEAGLIMVPWECSSLITTLSYDQVRYHSEHTSKSRVSGIGFNFDYQQRLWRDFSLGVKGQFKRPYNYLEAILNWSRELTCGDLGIGVFVNHVWGKYKLPSSTSVGAEVSLSFGVEGFSLFPSCCNTNDCCEDGCDAYNCCLCDGGELSAWVSDPAVYMPEVLAVTATCRPPSSTTVILPSFPTGVSTFNVAQFFTGSDLDFSATGLPSGVSISKNGILTVINSGTTSTTTITITAEGSCGTTSATTTLILIGSA